MPAAPASCTRGNASRSGAWLPAVVARTAFCAGELDSLSSVGGADGLSGSRSMAVAFRPASNWTGGFPASGSPPLNPNSEIGIGSARVSRASSGVAPELSSPHSVGRCGREELCGTKFSARRRKPHAGGVCSRTEGRLPVSTSAFGLKGDCPPTLGHAEQSPFQAASETDATPVPRFTNGRANASNTTMFAMFCEASRRRDLGKQGLRATCSTKHAKDLRI